jgi:hypothetical protein
MFCSFVGSVTPAIGHWSPYSWARTRIAREYGLPAGRRWPLVSFPALRATEGRGAVPRACDRAAGARRQWTAGGDSRHTARELRRAEAMRSNQVGPDGEPNPP